MSNPTNPSKTDFEWELHSVSCQIRFLSESIPSWLRADSAPSSDAAYGLELIMDALADKAMCLSENLSGKGASHA